MLHAVLVAAVLRAEIHHFATNPFAEAGGGGNVTLVENDRPQLDAGYWLDYFKRCHCDAVTVSAGGVVAFYPTKVPLHYRSAWLGDRDSFGDLCRGCQKLGMVVVARVAPPLFTKTATAPTPSGPRWTSAAPCVATPSCPSSTSVCTHGRYNRDFLTEVIREVVATYKVDGVFANRWADTGGFTVCHCAWCRASFGREIPHTRDPRDPNWVALLAHEALGRRDPQNQTRCHVPAEFGRRRR